MKGPVNTIGVVRKKTDSSPALKDPVCEMWASFKHKMEANDEQDPCVMYILMHMILYISYDMLGILRVGNPLTLIVK